MRHTLPALFAVICLSLHAPAQNAPAPAPAPAKDKPATAGMPKDLLPVDLTLAAPEAKKAHEDFLKLSAEEQQKFQTLIEEGGKYFNERRLTDAMERFNAAEKIWKLNPNLLNLKGSCLVNIRDIPRAAEYFGLASRLYPDFVQAAFNYAEMEFVQQHFDNAEKLFTALMTKDKDIDAQTRKLSEYKVILCKIKQNNLAAAQAMIGKYDLFDDTPLFFYSNAALMFNQGDQKKALEWVNNAREVYGPEFAPIYEDALIELGWLSVR